MAASALFVLDLKGRILLSRDYRGDVNPKQAERFITKLNELEEAGKVTPVILDEGVSYIYVQYSNLYLLAVAKNNINAGAILLFLHKLKEIFTHYFQELEEESLRDNFVIAYELLDEVSTVLLISVQQLCMQPYVQEKEFPVMPCSLTVVAFRSWILATPSLLKPRSCLSISRLMLTKWRYAVRLCCGTSTCMQPYLSLAHIFVVA